MKNSLITLCFLLLAGTPQKGSAMEDLDAFFSEAGVWPEQAEDVFKVTFHDGHYFVLNGYQLQILRMEAESRELLVVGMLEFENFGDPQSPEAGLREIVVIGSRAYIKEQRRSGDVWHAVDISDFTKPELRPEPEFASHRTIVSNDRVAVSSTLNESKLFEVEESGDLVLKHTFSGYPVWGSPHFLGGYLIMQLEGSILTWVDITDLENPIVMETIDVPNLGNFAPWKNYVFNRRTASLEVYDFAEPTNPRETTILVAETTLGGPPTTVVDYPIFYTGKSLPSDPSEDRGLIEAFNITDPRNPRLIGQKVISNSIYDIDIANSQLVVVARRRNVDRTDRIGEMQFFDLPTHSVLDSDRDGVDDLTEFAVGGGGPGSITMINGTPTFQYGKSAPAIPNLDYIVEVSDLKSNEWEPASTDVLSSFLFGNEIRNVPLGATKPYARLRVTVKE